MQEISMSALSSFQRCQRQFMYGYEQGLSPKASNENMDIGTAFHKAVQGGYRKLQTHPGWNTVDFLSGSVLALDELLTHGYEYDGVRRRVTLTKEQADTVRDMVAYYWEYEGRNHKFDEIVSVEEPLTYEIGGFAIRCTFDLLARKDGRLILVDHKTTASVKDGLEFLALDFQFMMYDLAAREKYKEPVELWYNMVRREVPPGYGHNTGLTASGRRSTKSTDKNDYLRVERTIRSDKQQVAFFQELRDLLSAVDDAQTRGRFLRSPVKMGPMSCKQCPFFTICHTELAGNEVSKETLEMGFDVKPKKVAA